ncbi:RMD1 family protein [Sporobolomyces koalae]|uniref:RMD1 family protein n=1 Tax=Sporobolomyces koalae TaxID=500713 RepID=UPI003182B923
MLRAGSRSLFATACSRRLYATGPTAPPSAAAASLPASSSSATAPALQVPPPRPQKHSKAKKQKSQQSVPLNLNLSKQSAFTSTQSPSPSLRQLLPQLQSTTIATHTDRLGPSHGKAIALTTAESYDTRVLLKGLEHLGLLGNAVNLLGEAILLPRWSPATSASGAGQPEVGQVFIFESGTIVLWGLSMHAAEHFLKTVIRGATRSSDLEPFGGWVEQGRYNEPETEVLEYWIGNGPTRMSGDSIHLSTAPSFTLESTSCASSSSMPSTPSQDLLERLAFSAGMARVTKLGVYEEQFDEFAEGVSDIPKLLQSGSESPVKKTDIIKRVGTLHQFRQKLNLEDENLLDEPEFLWEDARLHGLYTSVCSALEFETRLTTLNDRVDYAFSLQTTLMELLNAQTSHRLEWIIIILIAFEISLVLYREGLPFVSGESDPEDRSHKKSSH